MNPETRFASIAMSMHTWVKKICLLFFAICLAAITNGQSTANYSFATGTSGSLTDMSSGTTQLIAANQDDVASALTNIGFDFFFQGVRYSQFSVNSNGSIRLGNVVISGTLYDPLAQVNTPIITAYGANQRTHSGDGKVHFKITGAAPNRVLVVEWLNCQSTFNTGGTADLTYQVRLYETTGVIEFVYGGMTMSAAGAADANSNTPQIGCSSSNVVNTLGSVTAAQSGVPAPTYNGSGTSAAINTYTAGAISVLSSAADGSRRTFSLTPPTPTDPTSLSFTGISTTSMTLNWMDNASNEAGYAIYQSTDGINYSFINQVAANSTSSVQTGLMASTVYYWKVMAVTEGALSNAASGNQATPNAGNITSNGTGGGLWSATTTWSGGVVPTANDSVTIQDGDVVTLDASGSAYMLTVGGGNSGILQFEPTTARVLTIAYDVIIAAGGLFQSAATGTQTGHVLSLGGNLTNNGTLDFSTNSNTAGAGITFTGATNNTFGGTGAVTDISQLTINKGTSNTNILELNPANFTVKGSVIDDVVGGFLVLSNGMLKVSGSFTYTGRVFGAAAYTISASTGVWLNNPSFTIAAQNGNVINNGILRLTNGAWNCGTTNAATVTGGAGASFIIEGGTLNIAGRMNPASAVFYNQSGGVVNISTVGNTGSGTTNGGFTLPASAAFTMSGGVINLVQPSTGATPIDWIVSATTNYTGGTLNAGTAATTTNFNFRLRGSVPALVINNTTNNKTVTFTAQVNTYGNVTINSGTTLVSSGQVWLVYSPTITNNGAINILTSGGRWYFYGSVPQTYTGSGTATLVAPSGSVDLTLDNPSGLTIDPSSNGVITQRVNFFRGGITNANKLTLGNGGTTVGVIQYGLTGGIVTTGNFDVAPNFNIGSGGQTLLYAQEPTPRTTGVEVSPSRLLTTLNVNNTNGIVITGGDLTISTGTTPTLTMAAGNITTGANTLTLGGSAAVPGTYTYTAGTIVGNFKRWISTATGNRDFPIGISAAKRNASINFTTAPTTGGTLTAQWVSAPPGINGLPLTEGSINVNSTCNDGCWRVVAGDGLAGGIYTGTFTATGVSEITDVTKLVLVKRPNSNSPWILDGTHVTGSGTTSIPVISRTGMSGFSEFGIGSDNFTILPITLLTFSGQRVGSVNRLHWTTISEQNNRGFEVQRSPDGLNYSVLGFVNSQALGGNSRTTLSYDYTDNNPAGTIQYYRLRQVDLDDQSRYSPVILIREEKPVILSIDGLFPNPAGAVVNVRIASPLKDRLAIVITDINGRVMVRQMANVETGSNTIPVDISRLAGGTYMTKLVCSSHCESAIVRFIKQ